MAAGLGDAGYKIIIHRLNFPHALYLGLVWFHAMILAHDSREENLAYMEYLMKSICKTFLEIDETFRDESNDGN